MLKKYIKRIVRELLYSQYNVRAWDTIATLDWIREYNQNCPQTAYLPTRLNFGKDLKGKETIVIENKDYTLQEFATLICEANNWVVEPKGETKAKLIKRK